MRFIIIIFNLLIFLFSIGCFVVVNCEIGVKNDDHIHIGDIHKGGLGLKKVKVKYSEKQQIGTKTPQKEGRNNEEGGEGKEKGGKKLGGGGRKWIGKIMKMGSKKEVGGGHPKIVEVPMLEICHKIKGIEEEIVENKKKMKKMEEEIEEKKNGKIFRGIFGPGEREEIGKLEGWKRKKEELEGEKERGAKEVEEIMVELEEKHEKKTEGPIRDWMGRREGVLEEFGRKKDELKKQFEQKKAVIDEKYEIAKGNLDKNYSDWKEATKPEYLKEIGQINEEYRKIKEILDEKWMELEKEYKKLGKPKGFWQQFKKTTKLAQNWKNDKKEKHKKSAKTKIPKTAVKCEMPRHAVNADQNVQLAQLMETVGQEERAMKAGGIQLVKGIKAAWIGLNMMRRGKKGARKREEEEEGENGGKLAKLEEIWRKENEEKGNDGTSLSDWNADCEMPSPTSLSSQNSLDSQSSFGSDGFSMASSDSDGIDILGWSEAEYEHILEDGGSVNGKETGMAVENGGEKFPAELLKRFEAFQEWKKQLWEKKEEAVGIYEEYDELRRGKRRKLAGRRRKLEKRWRDAQSSAMLAMASNANAALIETKAKLNKLYKSEKLYAADDNPKMLLTMEEFLDKIGTELTDSVERAQKKNEWAVKDVDWKLTQLAKLEENLVGMDEAQKEADKLTAEKEKWEKIMRGDKGEECEALMEYGKFEDAQQSLEEDWASAEGDHHQKHHH